MLPNYYYAEPRLENINVLPLDAHTRPLSWSVAPLSLYEFAMATAGVGLAHGFNVGYGSRSVVPLKGAWKYLPAYYAGLMIARWSDRALLREIRYDDKIVKDYMKLHPERFPVYIPKKLIETFEPWYPKRSGGTGYLSEFTNIGKKKPTDHYIPMDDHRP